MLVRPIIQCLLCVIVLLLELQQQTVGLLPIELEQNILQFILLLFCVDIRHESQDVQLCNYNYVAPVAVASIVRKCLCVQHFAIISNQKLFYCASDRFL